MHYSLCGVTATSFWPQHFNFPKHSNTPGLAAAHKAPGLHVKLFLPEIYAYYYTFCISSTRVCMTFKAGRFWKEEERQTKCFCGRNGAGHLSEMSSTFFVSSKNTNMEEPGGSNSKMSSPISSSSNTLNQYLTASDTGNHQNLDVSYAFHPLKGKFKMFCQITNRKKYCYITSLCWYREYVTVSAVQLDVSLFSHPLAQLREPTSAICIAEGLRIVKMLN